MELNNFPDYYRQYHWNKKHKLFGYPADSFPEFYWIASLEKRFNWLRENSREHNTASKYLIQEMIEWGGSQNGVLQKFNDGSGEISLIQLIQEIIANLEEPEGAIIRALDVPGLGLTYASKLLRFMRPDKYGALDQRIGKALQENGNLPKINTNRNSMVSGYLAFLQLLDELKAGLEEESIRKPDCGLSTNGRWKPAEIEMAVFQWADQQ